MSKHLHLIMPMGGGGARFRKMGFRLPKPLIELQRKPLFYWAAQSINKYVAVEDIIFVVLQEHIDNFEIDKRIKEYYPAAKIQIIPHVLNGAVLTCLKGIKAITDDLPILFNDCDHAFICRDFYDFCKRADFLSVDGALLTFNSNSPNYSYVRFNSAGDVIGTAEKVLVSNEAICGAYYFGNKTIFSDAAEKYLHTCAYTEFFVSGVYNEMGKKNKRITTFPIDEHISFGTPEEYAIAINDERLGLLA